MDSDARSDEPKSRPVVLLYRSLSGSYLFCVPHVAIARYGRQCPPVDSTRLSQSFSSTEKPESSEHSE